MIDDPKLIPDHAGWMDRCSDQMAGPIPVSLPDLLVGRLDRDDMDVGFIVLNQLTAAAFELNPRVKFVDPNIWRGHETAKPEGFYVLGYPKGWLEPTGQFKERNGQMRRTIRMGLACLPITLIADRGAEENSPIGDPFWGFEHFMYGQLRQYSDTKRDLVADIDGMSGGPVLSIERSMNGRLIYRLYGIQSAWQSGPRIVKATRVAVLDTIVE